MNIVIKYDSSLARAPAGFTTAVEAAVSYFDHFIVNPITVPIVFSYGEMQGQALPSGALGESSTNGYIESYSTLVSLLTAAATSQADFQSLAALPATDPTGGAQFWVSDAQAKVFGLGGNPNFTDPEDGFAALSSAFSFTFDPNNRAVGGLNDAIGVLEHEISEALGRIGYLGQSSFQGDTLYSPLDLFRYSGPGVHDLTPGPGFFSVDGQHMLLPYNDPSTGFDAADWGLSVNNDAFGEAASGVANVVSPTDLLEMDVMGFRLAMPTSNDFTGSGFSDVLFGQSNGTLAIWELHDTAIVGGGSIGAPGGAWTYAGTGDFNGDQTADILFHGAGGALAIWEMNGTQIIGGGNIGAPGGTWAEKAVGDFNGDGKSDILFQDTSGNLSIWEMNGTQIIGGGNLGNPGGSWTEKALGDFNGDGKSDILFQDAAGNLAIWEMNGTQIICGGAIGAPGGTWAVKGVGDFNGDGKSDILFQDASGNLAIWEMNGTQIIGGGVIGNPGGTWSFAGIGDYNSDGMSDILFHDAAGNLAIWDMNGTQIIGGGAIGNPGAIWHPLAVG